MSQQPIESTKVIPNKQSFTAEAAFSKLAVENGNNLSKLIDLQIQQTIYINILFNIVANEQKQSKSSEPVNNGSRTEKDQTIPTKTK